MRFIFGVVAAIVVFLIGFTLQERVFHIHSDYWLMCYGYFVGFVAFSFQEQIERM